MIVAEYIWIDAKLNLRSKTKICNKIEDWSFDGSSTEQADTHDSDLVLKPVRQFNDPFRKYVNCDSRLVLCEVFNKDGTPHSSNTRNKLSRLYETYKHLEPICGIEQEYVVCNGTDPLAFDFVNEDENQGRFYCSVGSDNAIGRDVVEHHLESCLMANIMICGINAEVMPSQWEFQIGAENPLLVSDHLWVAKWILHKAAEKFGLDVSFDPKPVEKWNGSGSHFNFSTKGMRENKSKIFEAIELLRVKHELHIANYGIGIEKRLTGKFETCSYKEFKYGDGDRGSSVRIPVSGTYLEDRRPNSNSDPYVVSSLVMETICKGLGA